MNTKYRYFWFDENGDHEMLKIAEEIYKEYYPYWKEQVNKKIEKDGDDNVDLDDPYSFDRCLADWIACNWAIEVESNT